MARKIRIAIKPPQRTVRRDVVVEQPRLIRQSAIMGDYVNVLKERSAAFK